MSKKRKDGLLDRETLAYAELTYMDYDKTNIIAFCIASNFEFKSFT